MQASLRSCEIARFRGDRESIRGGHDTAKIVSRLEVIGKNYEKEINATVSALCSI
jgi:hypothetical protein